MNESVVLDSIPFAVDEALLFARLHVRPERPEAGEVRQFAAEAEQRARPRALYRMAWVEERGEDYVVVDGVRLSSRVLRVNLAEVHRVFVHVATGGAEMEAWQAGANDLLAAYWIDALAELALRAAMAALEKHLQDAYALPALAHMNPGSLADWPLQQQGPLFRILGETGEATGVRLTESYLMVPRKSVSGLYFPAEENFASCQLCPRTGCPNRRAPHDPGLYERRYAGRGGKEIRD